MRERLALPSGSHLLSLFFSLELLPFTKASCCRAAMLDSEVESSGSSHQTLLEGPTVPPQSSEGQFVEDCAATGPSPCFLPLTDETSPFRLHRSVTVHLGSGDQ